MHLLQRCCLHGEWVPHDPLRRWDVSVCIRAGQYQRGRPIQTPALQEEKQRTHSSVLYTLRVISGQDLSNCLDGSTALAGRTF